MSRTALLCIVALTCFAGASVASAQDTSPDSAMLTTCMPPGIPASDQLIPVGALAVLMRVEDRDSGVKVHAVGFVTKDHLAGYSEGTGSLDYIAYFLGGTLVALDDHPNDETQPELVDTGMMNVSGTVRANGTPSCQWARLTRTPADGSATVPGTRI